MTTIFIELILLVILQTCSARRYGSGSGSSGDSPLSQEAIIGISVAGGVVFIALMTILIVCRVKLIKNKKRRTNNMSAAMQMAIAQEQNPYQPPNFQQTPRYGQTVQHSGFNTQTKMTPVS